MDRAFQEFDLALSAATDPQAPFAALHRLTAKTVGAQLFTVTTVEDDGRLARRSYTSHPVEYPLSGTKVVEKNHWTEVVYDRRETFVANSLAEIATVFPDHDLIGALGLGSVVNMPVIMAGQIVATLNLLDRAGFYTPEKLGVISRRLTLPTMAAQLLHDRLLAGTH